jgi:hypothetical protein
MTRYGKIAALLGVALLAACGDKKNPLEPVLGHPPEAARIKFFNFAMGSPNVNFFADTVKMTAVLSATGVESNLGTAYGSAGANGLYTNIEPGTHTFYGRITAATDHNLAITTVQQAVEANKFYSYYQSGFYNTTTKTADAFIIPDNWTIPTDTMARVRFVNASPNAGAIQLGIRKDSSTADTNIGGATAYKTATDFVVIPPGVYEVRAHAATGAVPSRTGVSFVAMHIYTVTLRGDWTITSTTATNRPVFDVTANY